VTVAGSEVTGIDFAAQSAGTDSDNDDLVCDAGEVCGAWPTLGAPNPLTVGNDDVTGLDFVAGFAVTLGSNAASAPASSGGYRRLSDLKSVP
jgi:serine protease